MTDHGKPQDLLEFPCQIDIKAMGRADDGFTALVVEIVQRYIPDLPNTAVTTRDSRHGNYMSVTVRVQAQSRQQLDSIYRELSAHESVTVAL